jgi:hypothetical protein
MSATGRDCVKTIGAVSSALLRCELEQRTFDSEKFVYCKIAELQVRESDFSLSHSLGRSRTLGSIDCEQPPCMLRMFHNESFR